MARQIGRARRMAGSCRTDLRLGRARWQIDERGRSADCHPQADQDPGQPIRQEQRRASTTRLPRRCRGPARRGKPIAAGSRTARTSRVQRPDRPDPGPDGSQREHPAQGDEVAADAGDDSERRVRKVGDDDAEPEHARGRRRFAARGPPCSRPGRLRNMRNIDRGIRARHGPGAVLPEHEAPRRPPTTAAPAIKASSAGDAVRPRRGFGLDLRIQVGVERAANVSTRSANVGGRSASRVRNSSS